jgi:small subunit ribosomal protein S1
VDFGAFVELEPGLEGLVHISELSNQRVRSAADVVKAGQQVNINIMEIDAEGRRVSLTMRQASPKAAAAAASPAEPAKPTKPKKKVELRGGLEF